MKKIILRDRQKNALIEEKIFSKKLMIFLFQSKLGLLLTRFFFNSKWFHFFYRQLKLTNYSRQEIKRFIDEYPENHDFYEVTQYQNFNEFFCRKRKVETIQFPIDPSHLGSPGTGRLLVFEDWQESRQLNVKGKRVAIETLLNGEVGFLLGSVAILRMAPMDYHRFHFFDHGSLDKLKSIPGQYWTVNPIGFEANPLVFFLNQRVCWRINTNQFGPAWVIAVGGFTVGKIVPCPLMANSFHRGQEMGHFELGGSTLIMLFEKNQVQWDQDLIQASRNNLETLVSLGESIGKFAKN